MPFKAKFEFMGVVDQAPRVKALPNGTELMEFTVRVGKGSRENRKSLFLPVTMFKPKYGWPTINEKDHVIVEGEVDQYERQGQQGARSLNTTFKAFSVKAFRVAYDNDTGASEGGPGIVPGRGGPPNANDGGGANDAPF